MSGTFKYDVFLSYSSKDEEKIHALAERLKKDGLSVWLDAWVIEPGDLISLKIQHGLEKSRTLLMCMSSAYFESEWGTLEHHTLLFRDPTNAQRRFIPILVKDCTPPDIIAQFAYIDWRVPSDEAYDRLLAACQGGAEEKVKPLVRKEKDDQARMVLKGHNRKIWGVAVTPDGKTIVSGSDDNTLKVWDIKTGRCRATFEGHSGQVRCVAITPDGKTVVSGSVEEGDVFDGTVNFAARVIGAIKGAEIWLSDRAKEDIDRLGAMQHKRLGWELHDDVSMKGFPGVFTLWSVWKLPVTSS